MSADSGPLVVVGEVCGIYGVKGWVKVLSFTEPRSNLFEYARWQLGLPGGNAEYQVQANRVVGKHMIAKLAGIEDRDEARALIGASIGIFRSELPSCAPGEYYWADLVGLQVMTTTGEALGRVARLIATGANDVLVLDGGDDRMIPFVANETVRSVDLAAGTIVVDWQADFWE